MKPINLVIILQFLIRILTLLDISNYTRPNSKSASIQNIAIMGTNDLHGAFYPKIVIDQNNINIIYSYGGLEYLGKYITILRNEFKDNFLWFDSADIFKGSIESEISNGTIMNEFYNLMRLDANTIGNHDWDYNQQYLIDFMTQSQFPYIISNIHNSSSDERVFLPNQVRSKVFSMRNNILIGVIGITTITTPNTTSGDLTGIEFLNYVDAILVEVKNLRSKEVNAIVLISHAGIKCLNDSIEKYENKIRTKNTIQKECRENDELNQLLHALPKNMIDLVIAGHLHDIVHHWINDIPVITSLNNGYYATIAYLEFDIKTKKLLKDNISIEGPLPVCQKIFTKTKQCMPTVISEDETKEKNQGDLVNFSFHNRRIEKESMLSAVSSKWKKITNEASNITLVPLLKSLSANETYQSNIGLFYSEIMLKVTGADISLLTLNDYINIWDDNEQNYMIATFQLKGRELHQVITQMIEDSDILPLIKGLVLYMDTDHQIKDIKFYDGKYKTEIIYERSYSVVTIDNNATLEKRFHLNNITHNYYMKEEIQKYLQYIDSIDLKDNLNNQKSLIKINTNHTTKIITD